MFRKIATIAVFTAAALAFIASSTGTGQAQPPALPDPFPFPCLEVLPDGSLGECRDELEVGPIAADPGVVVTIPLPEGIPVPEPELTPEPPVELPPVVEDEAAATEPDSDPEVADRPEGDAAGETRIVEEPEGSVAPEPAIDAPASLAGQEDGPAAGNTNEHADALPKTAGPPAPVRPSGPTQSSSSASQPQSDTEGGTPRAESVDPSGRPLQATAPRGSTPSLQTSEIPSFEEAGLEVADDTEVTIAQVRPVGSGGMHPLLPAAAGAVGMALFGGAVILGVAVGRRAG